MRVRERGLGEDDLETSWAAGELGPFERFKGIGHGPKVLAWACRRRENGIQFKADPVLDRKGEREDQRRCGRLFELVEYYKSSPGPN